MAKCRKYVGIVLALVYAFFFVSTNFFWHTHHMANSLLVHSHPFSTPGHSHTANQILLINVADSSVFLESAVTSVPDLAVLPLPALCTPCRGMSVVRNACFIFSLRAPPAFC